MKQFEILFAEKINQVLGTIDPAHDLAHVKRVVKTARSLALVEGAVLEVVIPAAWLHDIVNLPKNHPERSSASKMAAIEALALLKEISYPSEYFKAIAHAIEAHSFSGGVAPETLEAKIVQDADRLDGLGAIGLARLFSISTQLNRPFYFYEDPFAEKRDLDDKQFAIDHIEIKLKKVVGMMNTPSAKAEALKRFQFIENYLMQLRSEIG
ncbi:MAG: HD domain-containing protein [Bacteriovorax sp.]